MRSPADIQSALGDGFKLNAQNDSSTTLAALQVGFAIFDLLGVLALFLGAFLIFNTFRTVVVERRHDIAMLRAVGATRRQITQMIVIESFVQGVIGTLIGLIVGYLLAAVGDQPRRPTLGTATSIVAVWYLQFNASAVLLAVGLGLATALIAGYLPARTAGKTSPLEALRPEEDSQHSPRRPLEFDRWRGLHGAGGLLLLTGSKGAVGGALLFLIGMLVAAPGLVMPVARLFSPLLTLWFAREGDLARGNLVRQPGRAAITASTLMIGLAVLILMAALVISFGDLITNLANVNFSSDILLLPQSIAFTTC